MDEPRLFFDIYSSAFGYLDTVSAPVWADVWVRWNGVDTASFALESDDRLSGLLSESAGRRAVVRFRADPELPETTELLSGCVYTRVGDDTPGSSLRTFYITGDFVLLSQVLGWPNPAGTIAQQGDEEAYYETTGPAETVALTLLDLNRTRQVTPITVAASGGRGSAITVRVRMHQLADKLFPAVGDAGVGIRLLQSGSAVRASGYVGTVHGEDDTLSEASGAVVRGGYTLSAPTATRAAVGGPGEGIARKWRYVVDHALEAEWGRSWEVQVDARDVKDDDPDWAAKLDARGWEALAEGRPTASVSAELAETEDFRFLSRYNLGDVWPVAFEDGTIVSDRITAVQVSLTPDDGLLCIPHMGNYDGTTEERIVKSVSNIARSVRDLRARN